MVLPITLPLDILACIVDSLACEDDPNIPTIQMLSLTCTLMAHLCRQHLFSSLRYSDFIEPKASRLSNLLGSNPDVARYVKSITYFVNLIDLDANNDKILDVLYRHSRSLQSIQLSVICRADWDVFPEPTKSLLISLIQLPTVTHLNLSDFNNFPVAALALCSNLAELDIHELTVSPASEDDHPIARSKIPAPTSLSAEVECDGTFAVLQHLAGRDIDDPIIDFSHLKKATFKTIIRHEDISHMCELLKMLKRLDILNVEVEGAVRLAELGACLAANAHRTLRTANFLFTVLGDGYDPLCGLNLALRQVAGNNVLEELNVDVMVQMDYQCRTDSDDWSDLDAVLTAAGAFPMLRQVTIDFSWNCRSRQEEEIKECLNKVTEKRFPRLLESTAVAFEFEEHAYI